MPPAATARHRRSSYWPRHAHLTLLKSALLDGAAAHAAFEEWRGQIDIDRLDIASERLLPLLVYNLKQHGVADLPLGRYDGIVHYTWVTNQRRLARLAPIVRALQEVGIPSMLMKGMALALRDYAHPGLRPMDDIDLLVPADAVQQAMAILGEQGWRAPREVDPIVGHARQFIDRDGTQLDLHWRVLWEFDGSPDDELWTHSNHALVGDVPVRLLAPEDLLLQVIVHGARWSTVSPIRWVADAMAVLRSRSGMDWRRLVAQAKAHSLVLPVRHALEFLVEAFDAPVPATVRADLAAHRATRFERVEQRMREWTSPRVGGLPLLLCHHVRQTQDVGAVTAIWRLPRYLQAAYDVPNRRALFGALFGKASRRLKR